ncbi:MAG: 3'-5' exonuclease domain-containing protein 2 [Candidatus Aminicenantes bacterium]|nr:3'-5' exonuclease domain-containing protein 2 [Candidatus Aminicenantes bacterium]
MTLLQVNRIDSEYINSLPVVQFEGNVVVVDTPEQEEAVVRELYNHPCVGFDTESKPAFKKGISYPISLLQLATHDTAYLFQLKKTGFSDALADFLANEKFKKIGIGVNADIEKLQELKKFIPRGFIDLSKIAKDKGIIQVGARALTARYLGRRLVKTAQKTNWAQPQLSRKQRVYAAADAWVCLQVYPRLSADATDYRQFIEAEEDD